MGGDVTGCIETDTYRKEASGNTIVSLFMPSIAHCQSNFNWRGIAQQY